MQQAGSVGSREHWLWDVDRKRNAFHLFSIVLRIFQLLVTYEPLVQFRWGFQQNVPLQNCEHFSQIENWNCHMVDFRLISLDCITNGATDLINFCYYIINNNLFLLLSLTYSRWNRDYLRPWWHHHKYWTNWWRLVARFCTWWLIWHVSSKLCRTYWINQLPGTTNSCHIMFCYILYSAHLGNNYIVGLMIRISFCKLNWNKMFYYCFACCISNFHFV